RMNLPKAEKSTIGDVLKAFLRVIPALLIPLVIIGGILGGVFTATESASIASLMALISGLFFYKELKIKDIPQILVNTATTTAIVTIIISMATIFGMVLTFERVPQLITEYMTTLTKDKWVFLLIVIVFLLI